MRTETLKNGAERNGSFKEVKHPELYRVKSLLKFI